MASKLQIKKSNEAGKVPQVSDLDWGELAINYTDGKLFYKQNGSSSIQEINTPATGAAAHKTWASLGSNGAAARRHTIARVYGTPNHWVESWQNIRIKVVQEGYSSGYLEYNLIGHYGMGNGNSWLLRLKDADGAETGNFQITLGTVTAAGWDYAGQPTYYQDVYLEVAYYLTVRVAATTYGHTFQTTNPTDGSSGCYTVFYNTPAITDGITYSTASQASTYHFGNKIWNAGNDGANSGLDADLLDGNDASAFALASHSHSYLPLSGGTLTGAITVKTSTTGTIATFEGSTGRYIYTGTDGLGHYIEQIGTAAAERVLRIQGNNGSGAHTQFFIDSANQRIYTSSNVNVGIGTTAPSTKLHVYTTGLDDNTTNNLLTLDGKFTSAGVDSNDIIGIAFRVENSNGGSQTTTSIASSYQASYNALLLQHQGGNVGIGTTSPGSKLSVTGPNTGSVPLLDLTATGTGTFQRGVRLLNSGMNSGDHIMYAAGQADSSKNMGQFYFYYSSSGSNSNRISMGLHSVDDVFNILGSGNVGIGTTNPTHKLEVAGTFAATSKSFLIDHPTKSGKKLRYGSLEGPENGVYVRGRLRGTKIELPDYWTKLVDPDSITVQLTPHGRRQDIWVTKIENNCVYVQGTTQPDCYYFVQAERVDVDKLEVEIDA